MPSPRLLSVVPHWSLLPCRQLCQLRSGAVHRSSVTRDPTPFEDGNPQAGGADSNGVHILHGAPCLSVPLRAVTCGPRAAGGTLSRAREKQFSSAVLKSVRGSLPAVHYAAHGALASSREHQFASSVHNAMVNDALPIVHTVLSPPPPP